MERRTAQILGVLVAGLAVAGLFVEDRHFLDLMNVDVTLDMLRIPIAGALLYAGFKGSLGLVRRVLLVVGLLYVGMGLFGLVDRELAGLLPTGLTEFDIAFHLLSGAGAAWLGTRKGPETQAPVNS